jgi:hypothetical protein
MPNAFQLGDIPHLFTMLIAQEKGSISIQTRLWRDVWSWRGIYRITYTLLSYASQHDLVLGIYWLVPFR